jgi:hypothetical protein
MGSYNICKRCNSEFYVKPSRLDAPYCSFECYKPKVKIEPIVFSNYYNSHTGEETAEHFSMTIAQVKKFSRKIEMPRKQAIYV